MKDKARPTKRLRAAVVGGGIGGLSAACALRRRGIDVMVFEQAEALGEIGAGLAIFPNALRQLERMGLGEALAAVGAKIGDGSRVLPGGWNSRRIDGHDRLQRLERHLRHAQG